MGAVTYSTDPASRGLCLGITANISDSGICIQTHEPLRSGDRIVIRSSLPVSFRKAHIMWVRKDPGDFYRAGLMFVE